MLNGFWQKLGGWYIWVTAFSILRWLTGGYLTWLKDLKTPVYIHVLYQTSVVSTSICLSNHHIPDEIVAKVGVIMHSSAVLWHLSHRLCRGTVINGQNKLTYLLSIGCVGDCITHRGKVFTAAVFQQVLAYEVHQLWLKEAENWRIRQKEHPPQSECLLRTYIMVLGVLRLPLSLNLYSLFIREEQVTHFNWNSEFTALSVAV